MVVIESEYTSFSIGSGFDTAMSGPTLPTNTLVQFPGGGDQWDAIWILTGTQFGPFSVTARELIAEPGPPGEEWEDVVELSVESAGALSVIEDFAEPRAPLSSGPGSFRIRVSARGRTESAARATREPHETEDTAVPLEHYLVELWPASVSPAVVVRESSVFAFDAANPPKYEAPPSELAAYEAGRRIIQSATSAAQPIDGQDEVRVIAELSGSLARVRNVTMTNVGWPFCNGASGVFDASPGNRTGWSVTPPRIGEATGYEPGHGEIETIVLEVDGRKKLIRSWNWQLQHAASPLLAANAVLEMKWSGKRGAPVVLEVALRGVPEAWRDDLTALWRWDLEQSQRRL